MAKVKGHAAARAVRLGEVRPQDKYGDDEADRLACAGADAHAAEAVAVRQACYRMRLAWAVQYMMLAILDARNVAMQAEGATQSVVEVVDSSTDSDLELVSDFIVIHD